MNLKGKTIFISGAARRIGRALSLSLANEGADIIIHHNSSQEEAKSLKLEIEKLSQKAFIVQADFSDPKSTQSLAQSVFSNHNVFGLINNASLFTNLDFSDTSLDDWQDHLDVNLTHL